MGVQKKRDVVCVLEGQDVVEDTHGQLGEPRSYVRYEVACPLCQGAHTHRLPCHKRRKVADDTLPFLGAWLVAASRFSTRTEHMAFQPNKEDIQAYSAKLNAAAP